MYHMEDILEVYVRDYSENYPQICLDEGSVQLKGENFPLAMKPGKVKKEDYEYMCKGFCRYLLACEPLTGKRFTEVTERRNRADFARFCSVWWRAYPQAEKIILVMDNLNTHTPGVLYDVFQPEEAIRIWQKLEIHYTPTHASWLNMAEIELSVLERQVLSERLENIGSLYGSELRLASQKKCTAGNHSLAFYV